MKVVNQLLEAYHAGALESVGVVPQGDSELYFAVHKSQPELTAVLRVALDAATPAERAAIEARWLRVEVPVGIPWRQVAAYAVAAALVAGGVMLGLSVSNRRLRAGNAALEEARALADTQARQRAHFIAYLSHELRGSLGGLSTGLTMLQADELPQARVATLVTAMRRAAVTLLDLCQRTLDMERWLQGGVDLQPQPVDLAEVVHGALAPWQIQAEAKGLDWETQLRWEPGLRVTLDPLRFTQVVQNLVGNAVKFTAQGRISVTVSIEPMPGSFTSGHHLRLEVADGGPGIAPADQARIFEPFGQGVAGKDHRSGAGLGLSIVSQIVEAMGGRVWIERSDARGSVFAATARVGEA